MKFLTDMHTHSTYSHDGKATLGKMLETAQKKGVAFYGVSEHFDYDYVFDKFPEEERKVLANAEPEEYFHGARHLQEDYQGVMNVAIGAEFGYSDDKEVQKKYLALVEKYQPDFIVNSVHGVDGYDYARHIFTKDKKQTYNDYLDVIRRSLDAPYPYDIVGHIGYIARYVPFENRDFDLEEFGEKIDGILLAIIEKGKILEVNSSNKNLKNRTLPAKEILARYFALGGRNISFGSDAHDPLRIMDKREEVVETLKEIGFTHITVPMRGEYMKVEL